MSLSFSLAPNSHAPLHTTHKYVRTLEWALGSETSTSYNASSVQYRLESFAPQLTVQYAVVQDDLSFSTTVAHAQSRRIIRQLCPPQLALSQAGLLMTLLLPATIRMSPHTDSQTRETSEVRSSMNRGPSMGKIEAQFFLGHGPSSTPQGSRG